jgi:uncharacterized Zn-finger protein
MDWEVSDTRRNAEPEAGITRDNKPFPCSMCGEKFARAATLMDHMRIHTANKPYPCLLCEAKYYRAENLLAHIRIHIGDKA